MRVVALTAMWLLMLHTTGAFSPGSRARGVLSAAKDVPRRAARIRRPEASSPPFSALHSYVRVYEKNSPPRDAVNPDVTAATALRSFAAFVVSPLTRAIRSGRKARRFVQTQLPMLSFLWPADDVRLRLFLVLSLVFMFLGKWVNVQVPFMLQKAVDGVSSGMATNMAVGATAQSLLADHAFMRGSALAFVFYGTTRALSVVASELKTCLFASVSQNVLRKFAHQIFTHLHTLDTDFHLRTPSGTVSVAYVRAVRGFQTLLFQMIFSVAPTIIELALVSNVLFTRYGPLFSAVTLVTFLSYLCYTMWITEWRVALRREMVETDNARNGFFIDSILNQEMVKLFTNEAVEAERFDTYLEKIQRLSVQSTYAIAGLNLGQAAMFAAGLSASLVLGLRGVVAGTMSVGDLVAVNSLLLQLSVPFNFMGYTYQELRQSLVDMSYVRNVLFNVEARIQDTHSDVDMDVVAPRNGPSTIEFRNVSFQYGSGNAGNGDDAADADVVILLDGEEEDDELVEVGAGETKDCLLSNISFTVQSGQNVAIVGPSGSGKSTVLRLMTRMLEPTAGAVLIDGVDTRHVSLRSLRRRISVVPQDTSLFDGTVEYNIKYGNFSATATDFKAAVDRCNLAPVIARLENGFQTEVGERGARLSGGERQKVSIARALLKDPSVILCDEVTSSVDAFAEREIVTSLVQAGLDKTMVTIAHRLSSIKHCDDIIVMGHGLVLERGTHEELLARPRGVYRSMWAVQSGVAAGAGAGVGAADVGGLGCGGVAGMSGKDPFLSPLERPSEIASASDLASTHVATAVVTDTTMCNSCSKSLSTATATATATAMATDEAVAAADARLDVDAYSVGTGARTQIDVGTAGLLTRGLVAGMGGASSGRALKSIVRRGIEVRIIDDDQEGSPDPESS